MALAIAGCAPRPAPLGPLETRAPVAARSLSPLPLPDGESGIGFDDLRYSAQLDRVLVPAARSGRLDLIDPASHSITVVTGFSSEPRYHDGHDFGVTSVDEGGGFLFATDRTSGKLAVIDPAAKAILSSVALAAGPDYVRFVGPRREVWVTEPDQDQIEVFALGDAQPPTVTHAALVRVAGGPESLVVDATRGRAYTHLWEGKTVAVEIATRALVASWPNGCVGSRGLALDEPRGLLMVGCAEGKVTVLDVAHGGTLVDRAPAGAGIDVIDYRPESAHLYVPGAKAATLTVFAVGKGGKLAALGAFPTAAGAHCVAADAHGHAYVCDPTHGQLLVLDDHLEGR